ncbi:MAG: alpha/beta hydrolase, partial [Solirubrobacteraceae bacterium]
MNRPLSPLRSGVLALTAATLIALSALSLFAAGARAFTLPVTGPADAPRMVFDGRMNVTSVCLPVTNPAGGRSLLYGQRFTDGPISGSAPAIVLVHGIASSTEDWDFSPTWSVARALASAGFVVYSYDRLGYAASNYFAQTGGGYSLTTAAHRAMLHDVVSDVKSGAYSTTTGSDCSGVTRAGGDHSVKVVVIGHSAGGWVVSGYPGQYHDVAAMVQADISGSAGGGGASPLGGNSSGGAFTPDPAHPDYFQFFQTAQNCYDFNTYAPGEVAYAAQIACTPPYLDSPYGEIADLGAKYAQNDAEIAMIGPSIPVLLTSGVQDTTDPPASAQADYAYYQAHCGCNVSQLLLPDTAHLFQVHRSLPVWVDHVVNWLSAHGVTGTPAAPTPGQPTGSGPPRAGRCATATGRITAHTLGPVALDTTRSRLRRRLVRFSARHG